MFLNFLFVEVLFDGIVCNRFVDFLTDFLVQIVFLLLFLGLDRHGVLDLPHLFLEFASEARAQLLLLVQHFFVLKVQVEVLFHECVADAAEHLLGLDKLCHLGFEVLHFHDHFFSFSDNAVVHFG